MEIKITALELEPKETDVNATNALLNSAGFQENQLGARIDLIPCYDYVAVYDGPKVNCLSYLC